MSGGETTVGPIHPKNRRQRTKVPYMRVVEFGQDTFKTSADGDDLVCKLCHVVVNHRSAWTVNQHINTKGHQRKIGLVPANNQDENKSTNSSLDEFYKDLITSFADANVPLEKLNFGGLCNFFCKYLKDGYQIPSVDTLNAIVENLYKNNVDNLRGEFQNSFVAVGCEEANEDENGESTVLNILFKKLDAKCESRPKLVKTVKLETVDRHQSIGTSVITTLHEYNVDLAKVVVYATTNVSYMSESFETLVRLFCKNCVHVTCWARVNSLLAENLREFLTDLKEVVETTA